MKKIIFFFLITVLISGCEIYTEPTDPVIYMGGGKWTLVDYDIVTVQLISPISILKNDTICINSFIETSNINGNVILSQNYNTTPISRRFIRNKTQWEFEGYYLYCEWINSAGGLIPSHDPFWVDYGYYGYKEASQMNIHDSTVGGTTHWTFETNNVGVMPPNKLTMISPDIVLNLYSSSGARDKAATVRVILTFMR